MGDPPKFYLNNFWASYYKMLDKTLKKIPLGHNKKLDPIFEMFSCLKVIKLSKLFTIIVTFFSEIPTP